jgi:hypothetical protein
MEFALCLKDDDELSSAMSVVDHERMSRSALMERMGDVAREETRIRAPFSADHAPYFKGHLEQADPLVRRPFFAHGSSPPVGCFPFLRRRGGRISNKS